jgi:hypothetical protein
MQLATCVPGVNKKFNTEHVKIEMPDENVQKILEHINSLGRRYKSGCLQSTRGEGFVWFSFSFYLGWKAF